MIDFPFFSKLCVIKMHVMYTFLVHDMHSRTLYF